MLEGAVNKLNLSTGETGEFASENSGVRPEPHGSSAAFRDLNFQTERRR
jgi:hypothetical protein